MVTSATGARARLIVLPVNGRPSSGSTRITRNNSADAFWPADPHRFAAAGQRGLREVPGRERLEGPALRCQSSQLAATRTHGYAEWIS